MRLTGLFKLKHLRRFAGDLAGENEINTFFAMTSVWARGVMQSSVDGRVTHGDPLVAKS